MKRAWCFVAGLLAGVGIGLWLGGGYRGMHGADSEGEYERVTVYDTVTVLRPVVRDSVVVRYRVVRLKSAVGGSDSVSPPATDSVYAMLPVESRMYSDSLYDAWVSGYDARLDSLRLRLPQHTVIRRPSRSSGRFGRIGFGVSAGVGWNGRAFSPYVGIGVNFTLFSL